MILDDTISELKGLYGKGLNDIGIDRIVVGVFFTGVKLSNGSSGVVYTPTADLHGHDSRAPMAAERSVPPSLKGMSVSRVLENRGPSVLERLVTLVVVNALSAPLLTPERYSVCYDRDVLDLVGFKATDRIGMVGAISPFLRRFKEIPGIDLTVIEQKRENLRADEMRFFAPAQEAPAVLPRCDTVIITGAAISNGTIDALLSWTRPGAQVIVTGPTASMLPDALFARNVRVVSGVAVTDADRALDMLSEGVMAYHLFGTCIRKINITRGQSNMGTSGCL